MLRMAERVGEIWAPFLQLLLLVWVVERAPVLNVEAYSVSHTFKFPNVPFRSGVHHIHSPEYFLEAHGICPPGFVLEDTSAPVRVGAYHLTAFRFRTMFGPMHGRVFSNNRTSSEFLLLDADGRALVLGRLNVRRCGVAGHSLRVYADRLCEPNIWDLVASSTGLLPEACETRVEGAIRTGYMSVREDPNLRRYRCQVLYETEGV
jgi:hypothetical protein